MNIALIESEYGLFRTYLNLNSYSVFPTSLILLNVLCLSIKYNSNGKYLEYAAVGNIPCIVYSF